MFKHQDRLTLLTSFHSILTDPKMYDFESLEFSLDYKKTRKKFLSKFIKTNNLLTKQEIILIISIMNETFINDGLLSQEIANKCKKYENLLKIFSYLLENFSINSRGSFDHELLKKNKQNDSDSNENLNVVNIVNERKSESLSNFYFIDNLLERLVNYKNLYKLPNGLNIILKYLEEIDDQPFRKQIFPILIKQYKNSIDLLKFIFRNSKKIDFENDNEFLDVIEMCQEGFHDNRLILKVMKTYLLSEKRHWRKFSFFYCCKFFHESYINVVIDYLFDCLCNNSNLYFHPGGKIGDCETIGKGKKEKLTRCLINLKGKYILIENKEKVRTIEKKIFDNFFDFVVSRLADLNCSSSYDFYKQVTDFNEFVKEISSFQLTLSIEQENRLIKSLKRKLSYSFEVSKNLNTKTKGQISSKFVDIVAHENDEKFISKVIDHFLIIDLNLIESVVENVDLLNKNILTLIFDKIEVVYNDTKKWGFDLIKLMELNSLCAQRVIKILSFTNDDVVLDQLKKKFSEKSFKKEFSSDLVVSDEIIKYKILSKFVDFKVKQSLPVMLLGKKYYLRVKIENSNLIALKFPLVNDLKGSSNDGFMWRLKLLKNSSVFCPLDVKYNTEYKHSSKSNLKKEDDYALIECNCSIEMLVDLTNIIVILGNGIHEITIECAFYYAHGTGKNFVIASNTTGLSILDSKVSKLNNVLLISSKINHMDIRERNSGWEIFNIIKPKTKKPENEKKKQPIAKKILKMTGLSSLDSNNQNDDIEHFIKEITENEKEMKGILSDNEERNIICQILCIKKFKSLRTSTINGIRTCLKIQFFIKDLTRTSTKSCYVYEYPNSFNSITYDGDIISESKFLEMSASTYGQFLSLFKIFNPFENNPFQIYGDPKNDKFLEIVMNSTQKTCFFLHEIINHFGYSQWYDILQQMQKQILKEKVEVDNFDFDELDENDIDDDNNIEENVVVVDGDVDDDDDEIKKNERKSDDQEWEIL